MRVQVYDNTASNADGNDLALDDIAVLPVTSGTISHVMTVNVTQQPSTNGTVWSHIPMNLCLGSASGTTFIMRLSRRSLHLRVAKWKEVKSAIASD